MNTEIGGSLKETILKSDLPKLIGDISETCIDSALEEGIARDIPVIGSVLAITKTYGNIRDYYLTKKLITFLQELSTLDSLQRIKLIEKLEKDEPFSNKVGEKIIDLLSRLDDQQKPLLIAKAFKLYVAGHLNYIQLQRISSSIERVLIYDLGELSAFCDENTETKKPDYDPVLLNYINAGLATVPSGGFGGDGIHPTKTAKLLLKVLNS